MNSLEKGADIVFKNYKKVCALLAFGTIFTITDATVGKIYALYEYSIGSKDKELTTTKEELAKANENISGLMKDKERLLKVHEERIDEKEKLSDNLKTCAEKLVEAPGLPFQERNELTKKIEELKDANNVCTAQKTDLDKKVAGFSCTTAQAGKICQDENKLIKEENHKVKAENENMKKTCANEKQLSELMSKLSAMKSEQAKEIEKQYEFCVASAVESLENYPIPETRVRDCGGYLVATSNCLLNLKVHEFNDYESSVVQKRINECEQQAKAKRSAIGL